ncbi:rhodanese-like domain-containing protein [Mucilaginibacter sp. AW1-7]|uniref:rhodanese-like domain-containing protein n=1 Tax=Mucilaginibacter sp. AW1-7 TaxID=3349874 RepID=UPI003F73A403
MKNKYFGTLLSLIFVVLLTTNTRAQTSPMTMPTLGVTNHWTESQLLEPAALVANIKTGTTVPVIFNIGAVEDIKGATHIGAVNKPENLEKLRTAVANLSKNTAIVIYCGCCPFVKCPNIRPAFSELQKLGFTDVKLLNLATNLKTNWVDKGFPLAGK